MRFSPLLIPAMLTCIVCSHAHATDFVMMKNGDRITGRVRLTSADGARSYEAQLRGFVEAEDAAVTRFDLVALGDYEGEGRYTRGAPKGKFPFAVSFALADGADVADAVPPQGSRGRLKRYLRAERR